MKRLLFACSIALSLCLATRCHAEEIEFFFEDRFTHAYPADFFKAGGPPVSFSRNLYLKIAIVISNNSALTIEEIIRSIVTAPPFDRYKDFFVFVSKSDIDKAQVLRNYFLPAYNGYGRQIPGGYDSSTASVRTGLIILNVNDYEWTKTGTLGYAYKNIAVAQKHTILHELGHALAGLGEEYSINEQEESEEMKTVMQDIGVSYKVGKHTVWHKEYPNIDYRSHPVLKWQPLIDQGFLPTERLLRVQMENGVDRGRFVIPSEHCIMNYITDSEQTFCPVCQLEIIAAICSMSGALAPWEQNS